MGSAGPAEQETTLKLVVLDGPMKSRTFPLRRFPVLLGRDPDIEVNLDLDPHVSRHHCQILDEHGQLWLADMGGASGTRVYGKPSLGGRTPLFENDVFRVGQTRLTLLADASSSGEATSPEPPATSPPGEPDGLDGSLPEGDVTLVTDPRLLLAEALASEDPAVQRVRTRLRILQDITSALSGQTESRAVLATVLERVSRLVPADGSFVFVVGEETPPQLTRLLGRRRDGSEPPPEEGAQTTDPRIRRALEQKKSLLIDDSAFRESAAGGGRSVLIAPLLHLDSPRALLYLESQEPGAFTREELELVTVIANQAAAALANTTLYEKLRAAYRELESAHDQLVQTEKLAMIGGLAASISHDLRNVITPIQGIASLVLRSGTIDPKLKDSFDRQMQRLKALAQQLMSFSKPRPAELAPIDLNRVISDSLLLVITEARHKQVEIVSELAPGLPLVLGDANRLDQAFVNIILNAVQAMGAGSGGTLTIRTGAAEDVFISFADTGPGIPPSHLVQLGKPFFSTKGKHGNGLGIYGCKRIIEEEHGGRLVITSEEGKGATFTIHLRRAPSPPAAG